MEKQTQSLLYRGQNPRIRKMIAELAQATLGKNGIYGKIGLQTNQILQSIRENTEKVVTAEIGLRAAQDIAKVGCLRNLLQL